MPKNSPLAIELARSSCERVEHVQRFLDYVKDDTVAKKLIDVAGAMGVSLRAIENLMEILKCRKS